MFMLSIAFVLTLVLLVIISELIYAIIHSYKMRWINSVEEDLNFEFYKKGYVYNTSTDSYRFIFTKYKGVYISMARHSDKRRTKTLTPYQFVKVVYNLYDNPTNDILEPLFAEYDKINQERIHKENKLLFSKNNKKRMVKFKD